MILGNSKRDVIMPAKDCTRYYLSVMMLSTGSPGMEIPTVTTLRPRLIWLINSDTEWRLRRSICCGTERRGELSDFTVKEYDMHDWTRFVAFCIWSLSLLLVGFVIGYDIGKQATRRLERPAVDVKWFGTADSSIEQSYF